MIKTTEISIGSKQVTFETGRLAMQTNASVLARCGDTMVLATVVASRNVRDKIDYLPLMVDYEERLYAAGKIKGSRWVKREGRASDDAILKGRVIDRTLRPLFKENMRNDVQVVCTILCIDQENEPDMLAVNAAATALAISGIPFDGPVACVRVGKVNGEFVVNPTPLEQETSTMDLIVSGSGEHIMMVEAGLQFIPEAEIIEGVKFAQVFLKKLCDMQLAWQKEINKPQVSMVYYNPNEQVMDKIKSLLTSDVLDKAIYVSSKEDRSANIDALTKEVVEKTSKEIQIAGVDVVSESKYCANLIIKKYQQKQILEKDRRIDGRKLDETRKITCEVGVLPRVHGSAIFTRGETQALTTVTLGSKGDEQMLDGVEDPEEGRVKRYMHHYNFPGYSVGEVSPIRGPGRREIGHGALAERAVEVALPKQEAFPYTMRLVSEIMSSNGSTSMASTCGSTLALMDAGVPIEHIVGGCAMGLVMDEEDTSKFKVLTDISGTEDFNGHMDFKVTGSAEGVTALQLDIKVKGLTWEILEKALNQARPSRLHIIDKMKEALSAPRKELSPYAPKIESFMIKPDKIRDVIGTGGKVINAIILATGVKIDIEDSGQVFVASTNAEKLKEAVQWIQNIVREVQVGEIFDGKVVRMMDFGAFVEVLPGKEGMVHVSELANYRVRKPDDVVKIGQVLKVKVKEIDDQGRINLTHRPFAPKEDRKEPVTPNHYAKHEEKRFAPSKPREEGRRDYRHK